MDALNRRWHVFRALVLTQPVMTLLLTLFYCVGGVILWGDRPNRSSVFLVMVAIPTFGFFGLATQRLTQYAAAGSALGLPGHVEALRCGQIDCLWLLLGIPSGVAMMAGAAPSEAMLLCIPAAVGVLFVVLARWAFAIGLLWTFGQQITVPFSLTAPPWAFAIGRAVLVAGSMSVLIWWLRLPARISAAIIMPPPTASDASEEFLPDARLRPDDGAFAFDSTMLGALLGVEGKPRWASLLRDAAAGGALLIGSAELHVFRNSATAFIILTAIAALNLHVRISLIESRWRGRITEESLMVLTPRWPAQARLKRMFIELMLQSQIGTWLLVSLFLLLGMLGQWVNGNLVEALLIGLFAMTMASSSSFLLALSRREIPEVSAVSMAVFLWTAAGAAICVWGSHLVSAPRVVGALMIVLPMVVGGLLFRGRPLQFPAVNRSAQKSTAIGRSAARLLRR